jgi:phosphohistidine phosphatase
MTRRLILTRHAKSSWDNPFDEDHDRPLNARGVRAATAMGRWLDAEGYRPDVALVSSATRTQQSWERIALALSGVPVVTKPALYHASPDQILMELAVRPEETVLVLAHNPGISSFARGILNTLPAHPEFDRYPSGATAVIDFGVERWAEVEPGTGRLVSFITPRELD